MLKNWASAHRQPEANAAPDRRVNGHLRRHIDCLLEAGARMTGRSPITLEFDGRTLTVQEDHLYNETGLRDLISAIASHVWPSQHLRNTAIDICIGQLDQAIDAWGALSNEPQPDKSRYKRR